MSQQAAIAVCSDEEQGAAVANILKDGFVPAVQLSIRDSMELLRTRVCEWQPVGIDSIAIAPSGGSSPRLAARLAVGRECLGKKRLPNLPSVCLGCNLCAGGRERLRAVD